jgi:hypothetical protein
MQHGVLQPLYLPLIADRMLTWGTSACQSFADLGVPAQKLIPIGSPRHDRLVVSNADARSSLLNIVGLNDRPTFVFFSSGNDLLRNGLAPRECATWLQRLASAYADRINVVVRLHPNEDGSLYQDRSHLRVVKDSPDLTTMLSGCDWVGSLCSTVMYDALLFHKPVWQFLADGWPELADNWHRGLALRVSSALDLTRKVEMLLSKRIFNYEEESVRRAFANQGRAAQAIATYITSILETPGLGSDNLPAVDEFVNCQTN